MIVFDLENEKSKALLIDCAEARGLDFCELADFSETVRAPNMCTYVSDVNHDLNDAQKSNSLAFLREKKFKNAVFISYNAKSFQIDALYNGAVKLAHLPITDFDREPSTVFYIHYLLELAALASANLPCMSINSRNIVSLAKKIAHSDVTILINGPTGTGKEVISNLIHNFSKRSDQPIVAVNCAAIPDQMLESTLFGHEKGAFTGALQANVGLIRAANNGTILLDEISEMPLASQAKLLRVLQEKKVMPVGGNSEISVNVRIIATTNRNMLQEIKKGTFREDLFYRLNVFPIMTFPLSERSEDLPAIAASLLHRINVGEGCHIGISSDALGELMKHTWPGNVRELFNILQRARLLSDGTAIQATDLIFDLTEDQHVLNTADVLASRFSSSIDNEAM